MKIIAHRGLWKELNERNTTLAFSSALELKFGIETDFRDMNGELVISHDPAKTEAILGSEFFKICQDNKIQTPHAINIKSDGLQSLMIEALREWNSEDYFIFDMSIPDTLIYLRKGLSVYLRCSEYEQPSPDLLKQSKGIWLDSFVSEWYDDQLIREYLSLGKSICIVSPELHRRPHLALWEKLKVWKLHLHECMLLCTDHPEAANKYFNE